MTAEMGNMTKHKQIEQQVDAHRYSWRLRKSAVDGGVREDNQCMQEARKMGWHWWFALAPGPCGEVLRYGGALGNGSNGWSITARRCHEEGRRNGSIVTKSEGVDGTSSTKWPGCDQWCEEWCEEWS